MKHKIYLLILFVIILANFIAQIPYYFHQYHTPPSLIGSLLMLIVFVWFLTGFIWLWQGKIKGYWLTLAFLVTEFLFYLSTQVTQVMSGSGVFLHVLHPDDILLFIVFGIGYINLFVAGFYSVYLGIHRHKFLHHIH